MRNPWKYAAITAGIAAVLASTAVRADDGPWEVRLRAVYLSPANNSDPVPSLAVPSDASHINSKWLPDLDFEYFFAKHWSTELILTYPQSQTVTVEKSALGGPTDIGTFKHLPPILTAKYNFNPDGTFRPYVGVGVNLTLISNVDLNVPVVNKKLDLDSSSVGPAAQAGFDIKLADHWFANADVKWAQIRSDVKLDGAKISQARIDPFLFGVGIGYRFGGSPAVVAAAPAVKEVPVAAPAPPPPPPVQPTPPPPPPPVAAPKVMQEEVLKGVNFETASAKLKKTSETTLDAVAASISKCGCKRVDIRGYTDSAGKKDYNQKLSERRATAVKDYLESHGIAAGILTAQGFGEENPIASNATAEGRAQNRRVTVQYTAPVGN